ncbi:uncharacterized protein LOC111874098 isoform X2 [Cryptotermes secundus]|nr:uncharacterized protein LOC111874098 isoform X2 [Cryptotermes secundus]
MLSCIGDLTAKKQEALLFLTLSILVINVVNIVILEIGEWHFFMTSNIQEIIGQKNLKKLVLYARVTTSISTAVAIVTSFLDSQFTFCSMQRSRPPKKSLNEQVSDIEYILPRKKTSSVGKHAHSIYSQYAQSWVFETDTAGPSKNESPYLKLQNVQVNERNKTVNTQNHKAARIDVHRTHNNEPKMCVVNPIVRVEQVNEESNGNRSLNYMKSFSRTPSPAALSESSSQDSSTNPPIYECLERLTEPTLYRSRLNTAISLNAESSGTAVSPKPVRPRSEIFTKDRLCVVEGFDFTDKVQYASLMVELQQAFVSKKKMFQQPPSPQSASECAAVENSPDKTYSDPKDSSCQESFQDESQRTGHKGSDAEFSKELEAALQLIQDLESPNTIETPSETCRSIEEVEVLLPSTPAVCVQWENSECASPVPEEVTSQGSSKAELQDIKHVAGVREPSNIRSASNKNSVNIDIVQYNNNNMYKRIKRVPPLKMLLQDGVETMNDVSTTGYHSQSAPSTTRWVAKSLLRKKTSLPMFAPELEGAIFKSESLAYLSELELLARHARNKSIQRQIEQRVHQQISGRSPQSFAAKKKLTKLQH